MPRAVSLFSLLAASVLGTSACFPRPQNEISQAAARGDVAAVEAMLANGVDPNLGAASHAFTPMIWAARAGRVPVIRLLADHSASLDAPGGSNGWTPLMHALHKQQTAAALALIDLGADLSSRNGQRALAMAAGYGNAEVTETLLDRGVDPHVDLGSGPSLLALAAAGSYDIDFQWRGCESHTRTVRAIVARAPDLTLGTNHWDGAARAYVVRRGCDDLIALLK
jgi:Ankyrin repeats (3 copies)